MQITLITDSIDPTVQHLVEGFAARGHSVQAVSPFACVLGLGGAQPDVRYAGQSLANSDVALLYCPTQARLDRAAARELEYVIGLLLSQQGVVCINTPEARQHTASKARSAGLLAQAGIPMPATFLAWDADQLEQVIDQHLGLPVILKVLEGCKGLGVMRADSLPSARSFAEAFQLGGQPVIVQKYIAEAHSSSIRVLVLGDQIVTSVRRTAAPGEFRTNAARGSRSALIELPASYSATALAAARTLGVELAGVDLLETSSGPLVLEVNSRPGLISLIALGVDCVAQIISYAEQRSRAS